MNEIVRLNYEGKLIQKLTDEEIASLYVFPRWSVGGRTDN